MTTSVAARNQETVEFEVSKLLKVSATFDASTWQSTMECSVGPLKMGETTGSLKDGLVLEWDQPIAKGRVYVYLKEGDEIWCKYDVDIDEGGAIEPWTTATQGTP